MRYTKFTSIALFSVAVFSFLFIVFSVVRVNAATYSFGSLSKEVGQYQSVEIGIFLDTQGESINALEGQIVLPSSALAVSTRAGNSIVSFWLENPTINGSIVSFKGVIPGGYNGSRGYLFSLVIKPQQLGALSIASSNEQAFLNDGAGTLASFSRSSLKLTVIKPSVKTQEFIEPEDTAIPELFIPAVSSDLTLFEGQWFIVFATQDKGSGIDHYEVCEGDLSACVRAESPHLLANQKLNQDIFVKAIDKKGNERVATVTAPYTVWYKQPLFLGILIGVALACFVLCLVLLWRKFSRPQF